MAGGVGMNPYKFIAIALVISIPVQAADTFIYGGLGLGAYFTGMGRPEITTPNMLGDITFGVGMEFEDDVDVRFGYEHWSSLEGFPDVFSVSEGEKGYGFNGVWLKVEKRFYLNR